MKIKGTIIIAIVVVYIVLLGTADASVPRGNITTSESDPILPPFPPLVGATECDGLPLTVCDMFVNIGVPWEFDIVPSQTSIFVYQDFSATIDVGVNVKYGVYPPCPYTDKRLASCVVPVYLFTAPRAFAPYATANFTPNFQLPSFTSKLTITTTRNTPIGRYHFYIEGVGGQAFGSTRVDLWVLSPAK